MIVTTITPAFVSLFVWGAFHYLLPTDRGKDRAVCSTVQCSGQPLPCRLKADWWPLYLNYLIPDSVFAAIR